MLATITIAIRPTPNHPSCRSTTVPPARPSCDGRRDLAALTAALDEDDDDDLGVTHGREGREPGVVLALLGLGVRDHLRGPRLAGDVDTRDLRGDAGAFVHHRP